MIDDATGVATRMFYEPKNGHGLRFDPFKAIVVPRPIGWISTVDETGRPNLAPFSFFNAVASSPPCVAFAASARRTGSPKDSHRNAEATGGFVVNLATFAQREQMGLSAGSYPADTNEFEVAGLEPLPSRMVKAPRVKGAPAHLECVYLQTLEMPSTNPAIGNYVVFGQVVGVHIDDALVADGRIDITKVKPLARMGYRDYSVVESQFEMHWPD
jgi:flavin reductase (DIM6/NTAB) family NADH-FMN oxidoreductase RutF